MCVKNHSKVTLSLTTATPPENTEVPPTTPVISTCGWTSRRRPFQLSSTTCGVMTRICWCRLSQRWKAASLVSPTTRRSISLSPWTNCDSSTAPSSCWPPLTSWWRPTSQKRFRSLRGTSPAVKGESFCHTSTWTPRSALPSPNFPPRKPSSVSFQTSTSAMWSTGMHSVSGRFRKTCLRQYGLDPANYYTSPGLAWDALLKKTGVELELLTDYSQHLFIEKGLHGGVCMASKRYARAINPMVEGYDPEKPKNYILYLDANNLCGWAMSQPFPTAAFRWEDCGKLAVNILEHPIDSPEGYILEVDLRYPQELHEEHNAYPPAPKRMMV